LKGQDQRRACATAASAAGSVASICRFRLFRLLECAALQTKTTERGSIALRFCVLRLLYLALLAPKAPVQASDNAPLISYAWLHMLLAT